MRKLKPILLFFMVVLFTIQSCRVNPITGKKELSLMSESREIAIGKQSDPQVVATYGLYNDQKIQDFISKKGLEMAKVSHRPQLPFEFKVVDSPVVNAFALPGGFVYFTRGILAHFNNEAEFAGVLGHEIGHVTARHAADQQTKQILGQVGFMAGVMLSKQVAQNAEQLSQSMQLMFLKFGRDDESESDKLGVEYSTKIGYDASHMANFFKTLKRLSDKSGHSIPTFQSTHPDPIDRYNNVSTMSKEWAEKMNNKDLKENRNSYLRMIDGMIYGEDPKQGYVENNVFYHPELLFQFSIPQEWQLNNSPTQVQIVDKDGSSGMIFSLGTGTTAKAAADTFALSQKMTILDSKSSTINGFDAYSIYSEVAQNEQQPNEKTAIQATFIKYDTYVYQFMGIAPKNVYNSKKQNFKTITDSFKKLTDRSKIDRKPETIKIVTVNGSKTLKQVLVENRMAEKRHEEIAILNSMMLTDNLPNGMLVKIIN